MLSARERDTLRTLIDERKRERLRMPVERRPVSEILGDKAENVMQEDAERWWTAEEVASVLDLDVRRVVAGMRSLRDRGRVEHELRDRTTERARWRLRS